MHGYKINKVIYDDKEIYVYEKGIGKNNYIFVSGWANPTSLSDMYELADEMSEYGRCFIIERFGYGESSNVNFKRSLEQISKEMEVVLQYLKINDNIILIGHSLGTFISIEFAKKHKEYIKAILLIDSYPIKYTYERFAFLFNYIMAYIILFLRKIGYLKKINNDKLEKLLFKDRKLPEDIKQQAIKITRTKIYNKTVFNELQDSIKSLKNIYKDINLLNNIPFTCICRKISYKRNIIYKDYLKQAKIINVSKSSHFIHHMYKDIVLDEIKKFN